MTSDTRVFIAGDGSGLCGVLVRDGKAVNVAVAADQPDILAALGAQDVPVTRIGQSDTPVPCTAKPETGQSFDGLTQTTPPDHISALIRLALVGFMSVNASWDGIAVAVMPERSHWLHISAGEVVSFQSTLTPKLVTLLAGDTIPDGDTVAETLSRPERLAPLLSRAARSGAGHEITGALIGAELAATRPYWLGQQIALLTAPGTPDYCPALEAQGVPATVQPLLTALTLGLRTCPELTI